MRRRGFTLIELMVVIAVITILAGMALGGMSIAQSRARQMKTRSTVAKLHGQLMQRWEGYRSRRLPINPRFVLTNPIDPATGQPTPQYVNATQAMAALNANLVTNGGWPASNPLSTPSSFGGAPNPKYPTPAQIAVVRLLAMRELQRLEMPDSWSDLIDFKSSPNPSPPYPPAPLLILRTYPQLTQRYLAKINQAGAALIAAGATPQQAIARLDEYDSAECLYMILANAADESWLPSDQVKEIGDADGDGLPEFQDAWIEPLRNFTPNGPFNKPIAFIRWPAGFFNNVLGGGWLLSDYQDDPLQANPASSPQTLFQYALDFSRDNHDFFDPLKMDVPMGTAAQPLPRGEILTPLIYSAGPDGEYGLITNIWSTQSNESSIVSAATDPYFNDSTSASAAGLPFYLMGQPIAGKGWNDNITNHLLSAQ